MANLSKVALCLISNIDSYELRVCSDNECTSYVINSSNEYLCIDASSCNIEIEAIPMATGYNTNLSFSLDICNRRCVNLVFNFTRVAPDEGNYTFYLIDENYGLPINGNLIFSES